MIFLGYLLYCTALLIEISAFVAWIYVLIHAFREYELWIGIVSVFTPLFVYVAFDAFDGKKRVAILGITVASHAFSVPMFLVGEVILGFN